MPFFRAQLVSRGRVDVGQKLARGSFVGAAPCSRSVSVGTRVESCLFDL